MKQITKILMTAVLGFVLMFVPGRKASAQFVVNDPINTGESILSMISDALREGDVIMGSIEGGLSKFDLAYDAFDKAKQKMQAVLDVVETAKTIVNGVQEVKAIIQLAQYVYTDIQEFTMFAEMYKDMGDLSCYSMSIGVVKAFSDSWKVVKKDAEDLFKKANKLDNSDPTAVVNFLREVNATLYSCYNYIKHKMESMIINTYSIHMVAWNAERNSAFLNMCIY